MTLTQILQKIRSAFYTKAETDTLLRGKSDTSHNHNSTYLGIKAKAESAKSADSVAWANVSGRPTKVSQFTNDSGYITSSGSCNYANSAGSAPANGGTSTASAYLNDYGTLQYGVNRLQYFNTNTTTTSGASDVANPTQDWYYHIIQSHSNGSGYYFDIASHFHSNSVYYRRIAGGMESGWIKFIDSDNIGSQSVNYANSAGAVAWANVSGKPTIPSNTNQLTNGAGFITSSGSCNYANSSGNADTVDGSHAWQMQTLSAGGQTHGSVNWLLQCQHNVDGDNLFKLYVGDKSIATKVDRANSSGYADLCGYSRLLATYADDGGHFLCPDRYDGWNTRLYMTYGDKSVKADSVHVHHADYAARSAGDGAFFISGYQIYVG